SDGGDAWIWATSGLAPVVSGTQSHAGLVAASTHEHYFNGSSTTLTPSSGTYLIQYIYIPSVSVPSEIMLQFHTVSGSWEHRAYWGSNSITACGTTGSTCGTNGTPSRLSMGPLPSIQNAWVELIVKADDVGVNGLTINGWAYTLYNGGVLWDYSALGSSSTSNLSVNNLLVGQKVELYNSTGALKTSATVASGQTSVSLNVYNVGINKFPFRGYVKVYAGSGSLQYSSSLMTDIWGGDIYSYTQPVFSDSFNPGPLNNSIHSLSIGRAQFQNATSTPEEEYSNYDSVGDLLQDSTLHSGSSLATTYTYDSYGNRISAVNPNGEKSYFTYSSTYQYASPTLIANSLSPSVNQTNTYTYSSSTLYTLTHTDPMANITSFAYDQIGRTDQITEPPVNGTSAQIENSFLDSSNMFSVINENGNYTSYIYDGLGRIITTNHYQGNLSTPIVSSEHYTYNWQDHRASYTAADGNVTTYFYDYLGRLVKTTYPDLSFSTTYFNDTSLVQTNYDQNQHRTDLLHDAQQRLIGVRQYYSATGYYLTSYSFDSKGNLAKSIDPKGQTTTYAYDDMNRLVLTIYPDGYNETRTYDNIGNVLTIKDPNGNVISYSYDNLNRLTTKTYPDRSTETFTYDKNNNVIGFTNSNSSASFIYDSRNRLITETWNIPGILSWGITRHYDAAGNMISMTYPDFTVVSFSYDSLHRVTAVKTGSTTLATITYNSDNTVKTVTFGNGVVTTYAYDREHRSSRIKTVLGPNTLLDLNYTYDSVGNVLGIDNENYSYDRLDRLTSSTGPWASLGYGYDGVGNRLWSSIGSTNTTYTYGSYNRLNSAGSTSYTYDNNGNLKTQTTGSTTTSYSYNYENMLTRISQGSTILGSYAYGLSDQRIEKIEGGVTTVYDNQGPN
ncbi:RHS repeat protein, partial [Candidatus Bathyarchaeota archaeon]|nr:RHS repeat protein [Candidatus Bathyarchaeota archaeon]